MLASIVTNRVAAEMGRVLLAEPSALGAIRQERHRDALRVTATDGRGGALSLEVPTGGRTNAVDMLGFAYSGRGQCALRGTISRPAAPGSIPPSLRDAAGL